MVASDDELVDCRKHSDDMLESSLVDYRLSFIEVSEEYYRTETSASLDSDDLSYSEVTESFCGLMVSETLGLLASDV